MSKQVQNTQVSDIQVSRNRCGNDPSPQQQDCVEVDARNLGDCPNISVTPRGKKYGLIAKLPVTLAELNVSFFVNARIDLPEPALEVKDIKKSLKITQCMLLQPTNVLFIKGFVRKNIDYSTRSCSNLEGVCGEIHHCTIDVPFECTTPVCFSKDPDDPYYNERSEFGYLKKEGLPRETFAEKDKLVSRDFSEFNQESIEYFNQLPFCDLLYSQITEFDEFINRIIPDNTDLPFEERLFTQIEEKMVIKLGLRILQNQQVSIPRTPGHKPRIQDELENEESEVEESEE